MSFYKKYVFDSYFVTVNYGSVMYSKLDESVNVFLPGNWRNSFTDIDGRLTIENIYIKVNAVPPDNFKEMFNFLAKGFDIYDKVCVR